MSTTIPPITAVSGKLLHLPGNEIDTDRIIPARFLLCVTFDLLGPHAFEDDRAQNPEHPFNHVNGDEGWILIVDKLFGCGSSREHAPQALKFWGCRGIIGLSFADIFFNNSVSIGLPCVTVDEETHREIIALAEQGTKETPRLHIEAPCQLEIPGVKTVPCNIPDDVRIRFCNGTWDSLAKLLAEADAIDEVAARVA